MSSPIDDFLAKLRELLAPMRPAVAMRVLAEVKDHLGESAAQYLEAGLSRSDAEHRALADFGPPHLAIEGLQEEVEAVIAMEVLGVRLTNEEGAYEPAGLEQIVEAMSPHWLSPQTPREREAAGLSSGPVVLLKQTDGDRQLAIWVGGFEALSIALALEKRATPRPMTHDFVAGVLNRLEDVRPQSVAITRCEEGTFYAELILDHAGAQIVVDCRPSDGIAVAVRLGMPIVVAEELTFNAAA